MGKWGYPTTPRSEINKKMQLHGYKNIIEPFFSDDPLSKKWKCFGANVELKKGGSFSNCIFTGPLSNESKTVELFHSQFHKINSVGSVTVTKTIGEHLQTEGKFTGKGSSITNIEARTGASLIDTPAKHVKVSEGTIVARGFYKKILYETLEARNGISLRNVQARGPTTCTSGPITAFECKLSSVQAHYLLKLVNSSMRDLFIEPGNTMVSCPRILYVTIELYDATIQGDITITNPSNSSSHAPYFIYLTGKGVIHGRIHFDNHKGIILCDKDIQLNSPLNEEITFLKNAQKCD